MEEWLAGLEGPVLLWIQEVVRSDMLTPFVTVLTHLGDSGFIWIVLTVLALMIARTRTTGVLMACSLLLNTLCNNVLLKNMVARTRPYEVVPGLVRVIEAQTDYSFPSGHTGCAFAAAVVVFIRCPRRVGVPVLLFAVLISLSRLYVGVHFPTDVLGGALIGTAAALLVCRVYRLRLKGRDGISSSNG